MMYTQEDVFAKLTVAFSKCHPKFPWPKKHGLADQNEEFRLAIADITAKVNEEIKEEIIAQRKIEVNYYSPKVIELSQEVVDKKSMIVILSTVIGIMAVGYIATFFLMFGVCEQGPVGPMSGSSPIYCVK
jgi:hypothetical protein